MKAAFTTIIALLVFGFSATAQMAQPVQWTFEAKKLANGEHQITLIANIADGWYVYSQDMSSKGPIPTKIDFETSPNIVLEGKPQEIGSKKQMFDAAVNMDVIKLEGKMQFVQRVKILGEASSVRGNLMYMTCNVEMCMPPQDIKFNVPLTK